MVSSIRKLRPWILLLFVSALMACTLLNVDLGPRMAPLQEKTVAGEGPDKVLMIDLSGVLMTGAGRPPAQPFSHVEDLASRLTEELDKAAKDDRVKALLLRIDSPGGSVAASDVIYHQIMRYKEKTKAKVVASMQGVAASGGYYVAMSADRILALPATLTGSVGVIAVKLNLAGLMGKYGVESEVVKSAVYKDMWSPFRPTTPEEKQIMQGMIDDMFVRFKTLVQQGRPGMSAEQLVQVATARVFTGSQAVGLGLVDRVGYVEDAFDEAKKLAGLDQAQLVVYHRPGAYKTNIYSQAPQISTGLDLTALHYLSGTPQLMYLWLPGL